MSEQLTFVVAYTLLASPALAGVGYWLHCKQQNRPKRLSKRRVNKEWRRLVAELASGRTYDRDSNTTKDAYDFFTEDGF